MIKSHENHFPTIYTWRRKVSPKALFFLFSFSLAFHRRCRYRDCAMREKCCKISVPKRFVCESHEIFRKLRVRFLGEEKGCVVWGDDVQWNEMCFVCREMGKKRWEKIWFRGWSWTTYNNELNIYHSVYLHHKEINVSSTFERKMLWCWVEWCEGCGLGFIGFSCALVSCVRFLHSLACSQAIRWH